MSSMCILLVELHQVYESRAIDVSDKVPISPTLAKFRQCPPYERCAASIHLHVNSERDGRIIPMSCKGCEMEWVMGRDNGPLFLVLVEHWKNMYVPPPGVIFGIKKTMSVDLSNSRCSRKWMESIDREWLRVSSKRRR